MFDSKVDRQLSCCVTRGDAMGQEPSRVGRQIVECGGSGYSGDVETMGSFDDRSGPNRTAIGPFLTML